MEEKKFFETFPTLKLNKEISGVFAESIVTHITMNSAKTVLKVYMKFTRLISRKIILSVENEIKRQIKPFFAMEIKIIEKYELSKLYTPESLLKEYHESILFELGRQNMIKQQIYKKAKIVFEDDSHMKLLVEDSFVTRKMVQEIQLLLIEMLEEKFQFELDIQVDYLQSKETRHSKEAEYKVVQLVEEITKRNIEMNSDNGNSSKEDKASVASEKKDSYKKGKTNNYTKKSNDFYRSIKKSDHKDVIYGREFDDSELLTLETVIEEMGEISFRGYIFGLDIRELKSGKNIMIFDVTDFTDSITVKIFLTQEQLQELGDGIKKGTFVKIKGVTTIDRFSGELTIGNVSGIMKTTDWRDSRMDMALEKRVELHCHTKMSELDGLADTSSIIKQADAWGHDAIAITDHGVVQAFTEAFHTIHGMKDSKLKILYGVEAYLVDDLKRIIVNPNGQNFDDEYVVFDLETTGLSPVNDKIIEFGAVKIKNRKVIDRFSCFVNPQIPIPFHIQGLTGINDQMVENAELIEEVLPRFLEFCKDTVLVAHNASFDVTFIQEKTKQIFDKKVEFTVVDTVLLSRALLPTLGKYTLDHVAKVLNIKLLNHHRAVDDANACADIYFKLVEKLEAREIQGLDGINEIDEFNVNTVKKARATHAIILITSEIGRVNLYRLISMSHLTYFNRKPRIPKSKFLEYKEGLLIGSACEAGEVYQAILNGSTDEEITRLVDFYDYLEIQPLANNQFMIENPRFENIKSSEDLIKINKKIIELGDKFEKLVVATCDVHFLNPEDEIYRRIIMAGQGFSDADNQPPLFLRTTQEMLGEFTYLSEEKAYEVVVTNTRKIAAMCQVIEPVRPDKCPPVIENSDEDLRKICYDKAHETYGKELPEIVVARLEKELNSIISNGYSVMYIIAQKLVWKSNEDGYLVGSRGSVGSSFVATMAGITEVNPLSPHYLCTNCFYSDFDSPEVKKYSGFAGCDMPDQICPKCGQPLTKQGFDIPFETFLGFNGDKEPDIDLNFSGEYQAKAHAFTEVIFGEGQTFKAGTVGTLADKTVYGYVKKYYDEKDIHKRDCEINRIVAGGVGVKRSTGQHPGGIIVLPYGEEIHSFTPIQHPANDMKTSIITTHFDYHSIDHNLLKLDILGHDDPTMIRMLQDLTGIDPISIPLDSKEVMSLFKDTSALNISPEDIGGTKLGCLGIPEFGTDFAMQMLIDAKPQYFTDLVRISGLSHGTDVWLGNAQTLIAEGTATISTAICTRDDIMVYLIHMGLEAGLSFKIMEAVRKGKGLTKEWEEQMIQANVPEWYILSCKKIKYMFPKAHAAAYVMMAWRIAYCKVFYPLEYYASYYSIRADAFSYELMCMGKEKLDYYIDDYRKRSDSLSKKEEAQLKDMRLVQEMYARGFEFLPIDLYSSHSRNFQIVDGKLLPPFIAIDGLGETAADGIMEASKNGAYLSKEDFMNRTKVSKTACALMSDLELLNGLQENNQMSLFDFVEGD